MTLGPPIDGETPIDDVSGLLPRHVGTRRQLAAAEAANILSATLKYLAGPPPDDEPPLSFVGMLRVHRDMFGDVWAWAGKLRVKPLNIGVPPHLVEQALYDLSLNLPYWHAMPVLEQAARLHHQAVFIHPFPNGNGRWSRMLANILLRQHGWSPTEWPEKDVGAAGVVRAEYLAAVRAADAGDIRPLVELHTRYTPPGPTARG